MPNPAPHRGFSTKRWRLSSDSDPTSPSNVNDARTVADGRVSPASVRWSGTTSSPRFPTAVLPSSTTGLADSTLHFHFDKDARLSGAILDHHQPSDSDFRQPPTTTNDEAITVQQQRGIHPAAVHPSIEQNQHHQQLISDSSDHHTVVLGFRRCAAETLRYLTEEEGLSPDDPLVRGLLTHLHLQEQRLSVQHILNNYNDVVRHLASGVDLHEDDDSAFHSEVDEDVDDVETDVEMYDDDDQDSRQSSFDDDEVEDSAGEEEEVALMRSLTQLASGYLWAGAVPESVDRWSAVVTSTSSEDEVVPPHSPSPSL